jgi:hypothetical protein
MSDFMAYTGEGRPSAPSMSAPIDHGAHWGLASMFIGAVLLIGSPIILVVNILMAAFGPRALRMGREDIFLATSGFQLALVLLVLLGLCGVAFAIRSLTLARSEHHSIALGLAGLLLCLVGLVVLLIIGADSVAVLSWFNRNPNG